MPMTGFHPQVARWFNERFGEPTAPQKAGWPLIREGADTLIAAPTGSGKTFAAFLWWINELVAKALDGGIEDATALVYVSPLKALGNDIQKNLQEPLEGIRALAEEEGIALPEIRVAVRSGDTPARERDLMVRRPPHILITTPESLYILLTARRSREFLRSARAVIVDEIHAVAGDKRGSHLALSLERLDRLAGEGLQRIGLSATQKPIDEIAALLTGGRRGCRIVDVGHKRDWDLSVEVPGQPLGPIAIHELWGEIYERMVELSKEHRTTLVFVNTRRLVERVAHQLTMRLGEGKVAAHHGSLSRKIRLEAERGLKTGEVPVVVATASLELGIDIGHVELVCHLGAPRSLATLLQRVGRSGHFLASVPKGILFPLTRDDLVQCAAAVRAARAGQLDRVIIPENPLDILAQQIVAITASEDIEVEELKALVRKAHPFRSLSDEDFEEVLEMLAEGVATRHGRRSARIHYDRINGVARGRRGARLVSITNGGAIPEVSDFDVIEEPEENLVGKVNEDFAIESSAGDIFLLGNTSWKIRRIESAKVRVENAHGAPPTVPFWLGEAPARTPELSEEVSVLRETVASMLDDPESAKAWLVAECGVDGAGAEQIVEYIAEAKFALGTIPTHKKVVAERFFDEGGGMQLVLHAPFGARINRAWGLALRKRFCVTFDFELQAAATDDGIVLSLGEQHSFPLESIFNFVRAGTVEAALVQATLQSPLFPTRWRWNATRALALLRWSGGRKVPFAIQRMRSEDLLSAVFPEQVACQDNQIGDITPPDHPLVNETVANCLNEAMDLDGLKEILAAIESGEIETISVETPSPSPLSHEILNANPFAFLDDAPLEERRARAVSLRRTDPEVARGAGALDPAAIAQVREQAAADVRDAEELHDLLLSLVILPEEEVEAWRDFVRELMNAGRITLASWKAGAFAASALVAAERIEVLRKAVGELTLSPPIDLPDRLREAPPSRDDAVRAIVHGWIQTTGPITAAALAARIGIETTAVDQAMLALEGSGVVLRGQFTRETEDLEWCERRLLARIHRLTVQRLRQEIEPVSPADLMRFLLRWQHVQPGTQLHGREGIQQVIARLQGLELPAPSWESSVLPARVRGYDPSDLEYLCLSGVVAWGRLSPPGSEPDEESEGAAKRGRSRPARNAPLAFALREDLPLFLRPRPNPALSTAAQDVLGFLEARGASFMTEISKGAGRLPSEVEDALWELVSAGLVTGDGVAGLRKLLHSGTRDKARERGLRAIPGARARPRPLPVGRWSVWRDGAGPSEEERNEAMARLLLRRYGVVFREMLTRERLAPPWRVILPIYRRWEAQQQIRGGRFVAGFVGEQFALPEAVEALRAVRRSAEEKEVVIVSAADPLNLVGVLVPGPRVSPLSGLCVAFRGGVPLHIGPLGEIRSKLGNDERLSMAKI